MGRGWLISATLCVAIALVPSAAFAAGTVTVTDPESGPLVITGFVGADADFSGTIRLHADEAIPSVRALFSDLVNAQDPTQKIRRSNLSLSAVPALAADDDVDVEIKVEQVAVAGTYTGTVELRAPGQKPGAKVQIRLEARARPALSAIAPQDRVSGKLADCAAILGCDVTHVLVPGSRGPRTQSVKFTVSANQKPKISAVSVVGVGEQSKHQLTVADLGLSAKPAGGDVDQSGDVLSLNLSIDPDKLPADHYTGSLRLQVDDLDAPVTVPIDFSVRNGPLLVVLLMLVGLGLGRVSKYMQDRGNALLDGYDRADALEDQVQRLPDSAATKREELLKKIVEARAALDRGEADNAKGVLDGVAADPLLGGPARAPGKVTNFVRRVSPAHSQLRLAAHVIAIVALLFALAAGFQTLYVTNGATFGSAPLFDYLALVVWGVSADVASRSLGNLAGPAK